MSRAQVAAVAGATLVVLAAVACSPSAPAPEPPTISATSPTPTPSNDATVDLVWGDGQPVVVDEVQLTAARVAVEDSDYGAVSATPEATYRDVYLHPLALLPDGSSVVGRVPVNGYDGGEWLLAPTVTGLWDGERFAAFADTSGEPAGDHPRQPYAADSEDGSVIVWVETESTDLFQNSWRIFVRDTDGAVRLLARAEDINPAGLPIVDGDATPLVHAGRVYWATAYPLTPNPSEGSSDWGVEVVSTSVDGSEGLRVEATGASSPTVSSDGLLVATLAEETAVTPGSYAGVALAQDGAVTDVVSAAPSSDRHIAAITADGNRLALVLASESRSSIELVVLDTGRRTGVTVSLPGGTVPDVAICGDTVVWTSADSSGMSTEPVYVLDAATSDLSRVPVIGNYGTVDCAGTFVSWASLAAMQGALAQEVVVSWN